MTAERMDRESLPELTVAAVDQSPIVADVIGPAVKAMRSLCPFLAAADGGWRSADAIGAHRCTAVAPPVQLATEKQRRLCLDPSHATCATFTAALAGRASAMEGLGAGTRPMPRTTPVVLERGRFAIPVHSLRPDRTAGQAALVILLGIAFAGVLAARLGSGSIGQEGAIVILPGSPIASSPAKSPLSSAGAATTSSPAVSSPSPQITLVPTEKTPPPSGAPTTYKVKPGDTLSGIASAHGTTWKVLAQLNAIKDPSALRVGTVLELP